MSKIPNLILILIISCQIGFIKPAIGNKKQTKGLSFATAAYPPFSAGSKDTPVGPLHDTVIASCKQMQQDCTIDFVTWNSALMMTQNSQVTGFFPVAKNKINERWLRFSKPITKSEYGFFVKNLPGSKQIASINDLAGFEIITTGPGDLLRQASLLSKKVPGINIHLDSNIENSFKKVRSKDNKKYVILTDKISGEYVIEKLKLDKKQVIYALKLSDVSYHIGFPKKQTKAAVVSRFDAALNTVLQDQAFSAAITKKYGLVLVGKK